FGLAQCRHVAGKVGDLEEMGEQWATALTPPARKGGLVEIEISDRHLQALLGRQLLIAARDPSTECCGQRRFGCAALPAGYPDCAHGKDPRRLRLQYRR